MLELLSIALGYRLFDEKRAQGSVVDLFVVRVRSSGSSSSGTDILLVVVVTQEKDNIAVTVCIGTPRTTTNDDHDVRRSPCRFPPCSISSSVLVQLHFVIFLQLQHVPSGISMVSIIGSALPAEEFGFVNDQSAIGRELLASCDKGIEYTVGPKWKEVCYEEDSILCPFSTSTSFSYNDGIIIKTSSPRDYWGTIVFHRSTSVKSSGLTTKSTDARWSSG